MSNEVLTGEEIMEFILNHKNGGQEIINVITSAADEGAIKPDERGDCLLFVYQDMQQPDSFFNKDGKCDIKLHTIECINMFLMAKYQLGLFGPIEDDSRLEESSIKYSLN